MEYYSAIKKDGIMPFAATYVDLENVKLSEERERERNIIGHPLYVESEKKWYKWTYNAEVHRLREQAYGCLEEGIVREFGKVIYTLLYSKWITNKDLVYTTGSSQCYVAAWMGREFGGEWIHVYVWLSAPTVYLKLSQHG